MAPKALAIVGTNGSGKSDIGIVVAQALDGEIVSADSRQVYRGFDLCTGKVTAAEAALVPHHLIDVADAPTRFTLHEYLRRGEAVLDEIASRQRMPVLVGGTPLYAEALIRGYELVDVPPDPEERAQLESLPDAELVAELERLFPGEAARIGESNHRRLVRAVERARHGFSYESTHEARTGRDWLVFGVTWPMDELKARIRRRVERRLAAGMVDEVRDALGRGVPRQFLWDLGLEFRFVLQLLEGELGGDDAFVDALTTATRRFAKRQLAWFRRWPDITWTEGPEPERAAVIVEATRRWLTPS
ncbi:MAG: tRNA dimethylallyltransferase [Actinomycetota bacterium]